MNRDRAKELLPVIQAFADCKTIESRGKGLPGPWSEVTDAMWFNGCDYRIKPEPREIYVNEYAKSSVVYGSRDEALAYVNNVCAIRAAVKYREVIEE